MQGCQARSAASLASRGSSPAVFILHVFSSANEQTAKETMAQEESQAAALGALLEPVSAAKRPRTHH